MQRLTLSLFLQASLLSTVLRLPMSFFDSQPTGRLLNRFTKDTEAVDTSLSQSVSSFLNCAVRYVPNCIVMLKERVRQYNASRRSFTLTFSNIPPNNRTFRI
jgi:ABC-type multidrug transport system fused ATPase/permease subunit